MRLMDERIKAIFAMDHKKIIWIAAGAVALIFLIVVLMWILAIGQSKEETVRGPMPVKGVPPQTVLKTPVPPPPVVQKEELPVQDLRAEAPSNEPVPSPAAPPSETVKPQATEIKETPPVKPAAPAVVEKAEPAPAPVVQKPKPAPMVAEKKPSVRPPRYSVQVGAFRSEQYALEFRDKLKKAGYPATILVKLDSKKKPWHTVRIGDFADLDQAKAVRRKYMKKEKKSAFITFYRSLKGVPMKNGADNKPGTE